MEGAFYPDAAWLRFGYFSCLTQQFFGVCGIATDAAARVPIKPPGQHRILAIHQPLPQSDDHVIFICEIIIESGWRDACALTDHVRGNPFDSNVCEQGACGIEQSLSR